MRAPTLTHMRKCSPAPNCMDPPHDTHRYLNDPDAAPGFVSRHVEPAPVIASLLPPEAAHHSQTGGPAGGGGQAGTAGGPEAKASGPNNYLVPLDPLVKVSGLGSERGCAMRGGSGGRGAGWRGEGNVQILKSIEASAAYASPLFLHAANALQPFL